MGFVMPIVMCIATAVLASKKGFHPALWFMGGGLLGLILLAVLPSANAAGITSDQVASRTKTGNIVGGVLTSLVVVALIVLVGMLN
jgi:hypothetical protein